MFLYAVRNIPACKLPAEFSFIPRQVIRLFAIINNDHPLVVLLYNLNICFTEYSSHVFEFCLATSSKVFATTNTYE
jgi:hypothetical protein